MNSSINTITLIIETALFLEKYATFFCQKGHHQVKLLQKYAKECRTNTEIDQLNGLLLIFL